MLEQTREVKVVIFWEKIRSPSGGMVHWQLEKLSDLTCKGKQDISVRSASRSPVKCVRSREVRLVNLWKSRGREGRVWSKIVRENLQRLVIERNSFEMTERYDK
ncbi:hypothetical protein A2U01_0028388 [Trifolium medium]|uniref:Uncharacterized protein n=1 Tax=Trifolium medium TaxID=97028 RepID=A0A392P6B3_9FABA|nr:hypothetical protein [Trifolium medium]